MAKQLDPAIADILKRYGEDPRTALWDCHGTWVVYHKAIERIAAKAGITFDMPEVVQADARDKIAVIIARGFMGERSEWSFGEAMPSNNKNAYPFAMAEKRAKDRVVLKLVGLHGLVYSEDESDDFKPDAAPVKSSAQLKREGSWQQIEQELNGDLADVHSVVALESLKAVYRAKAKEAGWPAAWLNALKDRFEAEAAAIEKQDALAAE